METQPDKVIRYLRYRDLVERNIVRNRQTLSRWIRDYGFPPAVELGPNTAGYPEPAVIEWQRNRPTRKRHNSAA